MLKPLMQTMAIVLAYSSILLAYPSIKYYVLMYSNKPFLLGRRY